MMIDEDFGFEVQRFAARLQERIAKDGLGQAALIVTAEGFSLRSSSVCAGDLKSLATKWDEMVARDGKEARRLIANFVEHYNTVRLHSAIGYISPQDKLLGNEKAIFAAHDQKLAQARLKRKFNQQNQPAHSLTPQPVFSN